MKKIIGILEVLLLCYILVMPASATETKLIVNVPHEAYYHGDRDNTSHWPPQAGDEFDIFITFIPEYIPTGDPEGMIPVHWTLMVETDAEYLHIENPCGDEWDNVFYCDGVNPMDEDGNPLKLRIYADETTPSGGVNTHIHVNGDFMALFELHEFGSADEVIVQVSSDIPAVPEYPSPYIPAIAIIGFLGVVLLIKRTRGN